MYCCAPLPQLEGAATGPHRHTDLLRIRRQGEELRGEEVGPQIPVNFDPQKTLTNRREDGRLRNGVGVEVVELHPVVVQERPHKAARWHSEPPLMEGDEANHVPRRRGRDGLARGHPLQLRPTGEGTEQTIGDEGLQILRDDGGGGPRVARRDNGHPVSHHRTKVVEAEGMRCAVSFSLAILLGCENQSKRQAQMAE
jgi:predicted nuclease with RNAse H fold